MKYGTNNPEAKLTAHDIIRANVQNATQGHGGFSQWNGTETLTLPLTTLRLALDGNLAALAEIRLVIDRANPREKFKSWAGSNGSGICFVSVDELKELVK